MKLNALSVTLLVFTFCGILSYYVTYEPISCSVDGASISDVNGFYAAVGGMYIKRGTPIDLHPDIFGILRLKQTLPQNPAKITTISPSGRGGWVIDTNLHRSIIYEVSASDGYQYIDQPPGQHWRVKSPPIVELPRKSSQSVDSMRPPTVNSCVGSLQDSAPITSNSNSNIGQLLQRPVTTVLLAVILRVAYRLWSYRVDVSDVSYSYEMCFLQRQYWRGITASFSHFDLMHLGFNCMALYSLGDLETVYSSTVFLYLSADLVVITMIICTLIYHLLITRFGRHDLISQQAVGYSCVLFAWMVALSARLREYCPIFLFPSFCIETWYLPLPSGFWAGSGLPTALPVNLGPFVLLIVTKLIIPRSSFIGHLSGIVIGYPLAWNMLNGLTPPLMLALLAGAWMYLEAAWVPHWPGYEAAMETNIAEFVPIIQQRAHQVLGYSVYLLALLLTPAAILSMGIEQLLPRLMGVLLLWNTVKAARMQWCTNITAVIDQAVSLMLVTAAFFCFMALYDVCNVASAIAARGLLLGCSLSVEALNTQLLLSIFAISIQLLVLCCLMVLLVEVKAAVSTLKALCMDKASLIHDVNALNLAKCCCGVLPSSQTAAFSGRGNRLQHESRNGVHSNNSGGNSRSSSRGASLNMNGTGTIALSPLGEVRSPVSPVATINPSTVHV